MVTGVIFILKGIILTEVLTNAARTWGIFDDQRNWIKARSNFLRRLLDCFECSSVWAAFLIIFYLRYFEFYPLTWALIFHRLACFLNIAWLNFDAARANKESDLARKLGGK